MFMVEWLRINGLTRIATFVIQPGAWGFSYLALACSHIHLLIHTFTCLFIHLRACLLASGDFYGFASVEIAHV